MEPPPQVAEHADQADHVVHREAELLRLRRLTEDRLRLRLRFERHGVCPQSSRSTPSPPHNRTLVQEEEANL